MIDERVTLARFLQTWLDQVVRPQRGYATWQGYEVNVRRHIVPVLGNRTLAKLSPADVQALINTKRNEGRRGPFSTCTPRYEPLLAWPSVGASLPATWPRWSTQYPLTGHRSPPSNPRRSRLS
jgi:hypothetical protein